MVTRDGDAVGIDLRYSRMIVSVIDIEFRRPGRVIADVGQREG